MTNQNVHEEKHESYGMLKLSRISHGKETILYGSNIPHRETILLTIQPGVHKRDLYEDWYYSEGMSYIEVEMSQAQFAEAITSLNQGSGIPVTIRRLHGKFIQPPHFENKRMIFEQEFEEKMTAIGERIDSLTEKTKELLTNKKSINKSERETILRELQAIKAQFTSDLPFISASYNEQIDRTTQEAKAEIEAFTAHKLNQLGLNKLNELTQVTDKKEPKQIDDNTHT